MVKYKQTVIKVATAAAAVAFLSVLALFIGRNSLLRHIADKRIQQLEQAYGLHIRYDNLQLKGITEVALTGFCVVPQDRDTLLALQSADVRLRFRAMLHRKIDIQHVRLEGLDIRFTKQGSVANYDFLFLKKSSSNEPQQEDTNYARQADKILDIAFGFLPGNGELNRLRITERKDSNFVTITIPSLLITDNHFHSEISVREDTLTQHWKTSGELNHDDHSMKAELYTGNSYPVSLPYITRRFGAEITFDTLSYSLSRQKANQGISLNGQARISGLNIHHKALSPEVINLNCGQLAYQINIGSQSIELDSSTTVTFNELDFHPYLRAEKNNRQWHFIASVNKSWFPAGELFNSLPKGLFNNLEGIETSGQLACHFLLDVDFASIDSLKFESELKGKDFRIVRYGSSNLGKMSDEFVYTAYENGYPVRTFPIGPSWEHFTPLDSISPLLRMSVLQSEDGAFFYHQGFLPDAMREALIHDLKVKRFARGGSTISMQLIKNVFLTRNKNFARKLEEALIVWLIETKRLTSKKRMYEVYLNIAEWGPMIYGIHEAANFYFKKRPSQLTTEESIFLASIIPKPKHFRNSFTEGMKLKENLEG